VLGKVVQVNVSQGGIPKRPVPEAQIGPLGIEGDAVAHPNVHGGPRQAVLLLTTEALEELKKQGFEVYPGALGENLTVEGLDHRKIRPGQQYRAGDAILEITKLRQPCKTIAVYGGGIQKAVFDEKAKAGDPASEKWGLAGFYAAVLRPGRVSPNAPVMLLGEPA
jgi:MOSC domain-containing protein YiiM